MNKTKLQLKSIRHISKSQVDMNQMYWFTSRGFRLSTGCMWTLQIWRNNIGYMAEVSYDPTGLIESREPLFTGVSKSLEQLVKRIETTYEATVCS